MTLGACWGCFLDGLVSATIPVSLLAAPMVRNWSRAYRGSGILQTPGRCRFKGSGPCRAVSLADKSLSVALVVLLARAGLRRALRGSKGLFLSAAPECLVAARAMLEGVRAAVLPGCLPGSPGRACRQARRAPVGDLAGCAGDRA
jgi:hypothetical protein